MVTISTICVALMGLGGGFTLGIFLAAWVFSKWLKKNGLTLFPGGEIVSNAALVEAIEEQEALLAALVLEAQEENNGHHPA